MCAFLGKIAKERNSASLDSYHTSIHRVKKMYMYVCIYIYIRSLTHMQVCSIRAKSVYISVINGDMSRAASLYLVM